MTNFGMLTVAGRTNPTDEQGCGTSAGSLVDGDSVDPKAPSEHAVHGQFAVENNKVGGPADRQPSLW